MNKGGWRSNLWVEIGWIVGLTILFAIYIFDKSDQQESVF